MGLSSLAGAMGWFNWSALRLWAAAVGPVDPRYAMVFRPEDRVLVFAPHPDDETIGLGATIRLHVASGAHVACCFVTDGGASRSSLDRETLVRRRRNEAREASKALGIHDIYFLNVPDRQVLASPDLAQRLADLIATTQPSVVYTTSIVDVHPDHVGTCIRVAEAIEASKCQPEVRLYEVQVPLTPLLANRYVDVTTETDMINTLLLSCYTSQTMSFANVLPRRHINGLFCKGCAAAEFFLAMPGRCFPRWLAAAAASRTPMRFFASGSPRWLLRSYLQGARARRRLAHLMHRYIASTTDSSGARAPTCAS